jgi:hypothetical protein
LHIDKQNLNLIIGGFFSSTKLIIFINPNTSTGIDGWEKLPTIQVK